MFYDMIIGVCESPDLWRWFELLVKSALLQA
uniref:Uncharacterized protein n=1 Tax=Rhizophora mucronata TaxID=61149 RepID=A0A2P2QR06_RHIMU